jgi:hypothetical protein
MNSDVIIRQLNRLANDQQVGHANRQIAQQAIQHIKLQDEEINKIRDDVSQWEDPDAKPPPDAA